jgi:hypothetical protein
LTEEEEIISFPNERVIFTKQANPSAASHVPKVSRIITRNIFIFEDKLDIIIIKNIKLRIIASKASKVIRRCLR